LKNSFSALKFAIDERKIKNLEGELESKKVVEGTFSTTTPVIANYAALPPKFLHSGWITSAWPVIHSSSEANTIRASSLPHANLSLLKRENLLERRSQTVWLKCCSLGI
jgi:hypothetical protein